MPNASRRTPTQPLLLPLRRASSSGGMRSLLRALGISGRLAPLPAASLRGAGLGRLGARSVNRLEGADLPVWLIVLARPLGPADLLALARALPGTAPALLLCAPPTGSVLLVACLTGSGELRQATLDRLAPRNADLQLLEELRAEAGESPLATSLRWARVLDRTTIGARFFRELRAEREAIARAWRGIPARLRAEREQLALLLLCRLLFLYFLQQRGHLLGDRSYLVKLLRAGRSVPAEPSLYTRVLRPLFFGALNTRPEQRTAEANALGPLPYLNGGLFEPHALERRHPDLHLPDAVLLRTVSDFLDRYRYASRDAADDAGGGAADASLDPEVLGRAFEALMQPARRGETGTYYTPPAVVDRLVGTALTRHLERAARLPGEAARAIIEGSAPLLSAAERKRADTVLRDLRVLDPACGSGAFLLGTLARIVRARRPLQPRTEETALRAHTVARVLHGVDLLDDAALLCSLRLWLALTPAPDEPVAPLPNLDRRIRQGDALIDPLDLLTPGAVRGADRGAALDADVRRAIRVLAPLGHSYLGAEPAARAALQDRLRAQEVALARLWLEALRARLEAALRTNRAAAGDRDLWGAAALHAERAARETERLQARLTETQRLLGELDDNAALPFFSFLVHFAAERTAFDIIVSNPPWVRAHRWPAALAGAVRERYHVCRAAGWPGARGVGATGAGQVDLALLFLERALTLLDGGGILALLLPAKLLRSLYAGGARELLLRDATVLELEDHSLDQRSIFRADAFTVSVVARRNPSSGARGEDPAARVSRAPEHPGSDPRANGCVADDAGTVRVALVRRGAAPLRFDVRCAELPLFPGEARSPWLVAPPDVAHCLRAMQRGGLRIDATRGIVIRRGVITGANDVLVLVAHQHHLGGLARVHAQGWARLRRRGAIRDAAAFTAWIESTGVRPLLRGTDIRAWRWRTPQRIIWVPDNDGARDAAPGRLARYLARHADALARRSGATAGARAGALLRVSPHTLGHKVAWQDIAPDLHAAAIPARVREAGCDVPIIPLNSVYFAAVEDADAALLLAAYLNSLPLRVFARAIAERAKDAHFRFFAWTIGALPLPRAWRRGPRAAALLALSRDGHERESLDAERAAELDRMVGAAYGLDERDLATLARFDAWLRGQS